MNKMKILIKGKVNEAKRKVIHKLGDYDEFDMHLALNPPMPARITHLDLQKICTTINISIDDIGNNPVERYEKVVCQYLARILEEILPGFAEFNLYGPVEPYFDHYEMTGRIEILKSEESGKINLEYYRGPALRKDSEDAEVDRGGDRQP